MSKLDQSQIPLLSAMKDYASKDVATFDVPGHKRGRGIPVLNEYFGAQVMQFDTNSLPLLDNVGNPTGVISKAQELLADAYGADKAFFMANGSTSAIHAMLLSVLAPGDKILIPKNIHKSALNGLILSGAIPIYMQPEICPKQGLAKNVTVSEVMRQLDASPDAKAVFVLNPTYFGHTSDLLAISNLCHERNVLLLVDEAHGAHFPFHEQMPPSAMQCGADASCISMHKTGGALTQASALIINEARLDGRLIKRAINILQSTSVSYLLMGSLDGARYNLVQNGRKLLGKAIELANEVQQALSDVPGVSVVTQKRFYDPTKVIINVSGLTLTGFEVYELLWRKYGVQLELCETNHVLAIISLGDTPEMIAKLIDAITDIANKHLGELTDSLAIDGPFVQSSQQVMSPRDAHFAQKELVLITDAIGRVSAESIMAYPPGIPIISPGESFSEEIVNNLQLLLKQGAFLVDNSDPELKRVLVVK